MEDDSRNLPYMMLMVYLFIEVSNTFIKKSNNKEKTQAMNFKHVLCSNLIRTNECIYQYAAQNIKSTIRYEI